jgi:hypothetical protein
MPIRKKITPPTTLKLFTEIPKKSNINCPANAKAIVVSRETIEAFLAVAFLASTDKLEVIAIKTGIVPNGFISVNNEVKQSKPNEIVSDISVTLSLVRKTHQLSPGKKYFEPGIIIL